MAQQSRKQRANTTNNSKKNRKVMVGGANASYKTFNHFEDFSTACESAKFRSEEAFRGSMFSSKVEPTECEKMLAVLNTILLSKGDSLKYIEFINDVIHKEYKQEMDELDKEIDDLDNKMGELDKRSYKVEEDKASIPKKVKLGIDVTGEGPRISAEENDIVVSREELKVLQAEAKIKKRNKIQELSNKYVGIGGQHLLDYVKKLYVTKDVEHLKELLLILDPDFYKVLVDPDFYKVKGYTDNTMVPPNNYNKAIEGLQLTNEKIRQWIYDTNNELYALKEPRDLHKLFERYQARGLNHYEKDTYSYLTDMTFSNARVNESTIHRYKPNMCWDLCFDVTYNGTIFLPEAHDISHKKSVDKKIKAYMKLEKEYESTVEQAKNGSISDVDLATYIEKQEKVIQEEENYLYNETNLLTDTYRFKLLQGWNIVEYNTDQGTYRCFESFVREVLGQRGIFSPAIIIGSHNNIRILDGRNTVEENISGFVEFLINEIHEVFPGSDIVDPSVVQKVPYTPADMANQNARTFINDNMNKPEYPYLQRYIFLSGNILLNSVISPKLFQPYGRFDLFSRYYDKDIDNSPNNPYQISPSVTARVIQTADEILELLPNITEIYFDFLYEHIPNYTDFFKDKNIISILIQPKIIDFNNNVMFSHSITECRSTRDLVLIGYILQIIKVTNINSDDISTIKAEAKMCFLWVSENPMDLLFFDNQDIKTGDWVPCLITRSIMNPIREALLPRAPPQPVPADYQAIFTQNKMNKGVSNQVIFEVTRIPLPALNNYENGREEPTSAHWQILQDYFSYYTS